MAIGNFVLGAEFIEQLIAFNAEPRLQRILRVINARVIDAAVSRARCHAEFRKLLDKKNVLPALRNGLGYSAADDTTTNDQNIGLVHGNFLLVASDGIEIGGAIDELRIRAVMYGVLGAFAFFVAI